MARPRGFDTSEALNAAMHVFWSKGYNAASLGDILEATGLSKSSLYASFGDKRTLFLAAFDAYHRGRIRQLKQSLDKVRPARQAIEEFFRRGVANAVSSGPADGCMIANEAIELAPRDAAVQRLVAQDFQAIEDAFAQAIERGQAEGSIRNGDSPRTLARFLLVGLQGLQVMTRSQTDRTRLDDYVTVMMRVLDQT